MYLKNPFKNWIFSFRSESTYISDSFSTLSIKRHKIPAKATRFFESYDESLSIRLFGTLPFAIQTKYTENSYRIYLSATPCILKYNTTLDLRNDSEQEYVLNFNMYWKWIRVRIYQIYQNLRLEIDSDVVKLVFNENLTLLTIQLSHLLNVKFDWFRIEKGRHLWTYDISCLLKFWLTDWNFFTTVF